MKTMDKRLDTFIEQRRCVFQFFRARNGRMTYEECHEGMVVSINMPTDEMEALLEDVFGEPNAPRPRNDTSLDSTTWFTSAETCSQRRGIVPSILGLSSSEYIPSQTDVLQIIIPFCFLFPRRVVALACQHHPPALCTVRNAFDVRCDEFVSTVCHNKARDAVKHIKGKNLVTSM